MSTTRCWPSSRQRGRSRAKAQPTSDAAGFLRVEIADVAAWGGMLKALAALDALRAQGEEAQG